MLIQTTRVDCFWGVVLRGPQTNIDGCVCGCNICNPNGNSKRISLRIRHVCRRAWTWWLQLYQRGIFKKWKPRRIGSFFRCSGPRQSGQARTPNVVYQSALYIFIVSYHSKQFIASLHPTATTASNSSLINGLKLAISTRIETSKHKQRHTATQVARKNSPGLACSWFRTSQSTDQQNSEK